MDSAQRNGAVVADDVEFSAPEDAKQHRVIPRLADIIRLAFTTAPAQIA
jgi:hypothetical protein